MQTDGGLLQFAKAGRGDKDGGELGSLGSQPPEPRLCMRAHDGEMEGQRRVGDGMGVGSTQSLGAVGAVGAVGAPLHTLYRVPRRERMALETGGWPRQRWLGWALVAPAGRGWTLERRERQSTEQRRGDGRRCRAERKGRWLEDGMVLYYTDSRLSCTDFQ